MKQSETLKNHQTEKINRRVSKPLMERRRRARINGCLGELRTLLLQSNIAQSCRRSKLEKADILELTVRHLKALTKLNGSDTCAEGVTMSRFYAGYTDCAREVNRFLSTSDGIHNTVRASLLHRLCDRATALISGTAPLHHHADSPHPVPFARYSMFSDTSSSTIDSTQMTSLQPVVLGQAITLPVADSAFSFLLQPRHQPSPDPGVRAQLVHVSADPMKKVHTANSCMTETVWRPW